MILYENNAFLQKNALSPDSKYQTLSKNRTASSELEDELITMYDIAKKKDWISLRKELGNLEILKEKVPDIEIEKTYYGLKNAINHNEENEIYNKLIELMEETHKINDKENLMSLDSSNHIDLNLVKNELNKNTKHVESIQVSSSPRQIKQDKLNPDIRRVNSEMISIESMTEENKIKTTGCKCDCLLI